MLTFEQFCAECKSIAKFTGNNSMQREQSFQYYEDDEYAIYYFHSSEWEFGYSGVSSTGASLPEAMQNANTAFKKSWDEYEKEHGDSLSNF